jgi:hypothetical protein
MGQGDARSSFSIFIMFAVAIVFIDSFYHEPLCNSEKKHCLRAPSTRCALQDKPSFRRERMLGFLLRHET